MEQMRRRKTRKGKRKVRGMRKKIGMRKRGRRKKNTHDSHKKRKRGCGGLHIYKSKIKK